MSWGTSKMSNGSLYWGPLEHKEYIDAFWNTRSWLNSEWSKEKQTAFDDLYNFGIFGWYPFRDAFDRELNAKDNAAYMSRYDIDYSEIVDPRKLSSTSAVRGLTSSYRIVSDNVKRLYK